MLTAYDIHRLAKKNGEVQEEKKKVYRIPKESKKRKKERPIYSKIVKDKIEESEGLCVLNGPTCTTYAEGGDHIQNRSPNNYADPENIIPACNNCNILKARFPKLFKKQHSKSRFKK